MLGAVGVPGDPLLHDLHVGLDPAQLDPGILDLAGTPREDRLGRVEGARERRELGVLGKRLRLVFDLLQTDVEGLEPQEFFLLWGDAFTMS
ncbi:hypothetical protein [Cryobacterium sp. PAMC25264]|uniref:hypothetical protein n=1 Tax=Cryobacterium sp. PAMC25264 TaxID=2861288 RepID=UPI0021042D02|nr:hypothetical protein [Cryobacterium sp. PAMC25264]